MRLVFRVVAGVLVFAGIARGFADSGEGGAGSLALLRGVQKELVALSDRLGQTVVAIEGSRPVPWVRDRAGKVRGSGFFISGDGHILTNEHVIRGCRQIKVRLATGKEYPAKPVGADARSDLAVLRIPVKGVPFAKLGDLGRVRRGQWVLAMGNPLGLACDDGQSAVSLGIVSAIGRSVAGVDRQADRYYGNLIQTTAQVLIGNSGGPLFNLDGDVIGITTIISAVDVGGEHMAFAVPISKWTKQIIDRLRSGQPIDGYLGISFTNIPGRGGAAVVQIKPGTPAYEAGLRRGDVIRGYDGQAVRNFDDVINLIRLTRPGTTVKLAIERGGKVTSKSARIASRTDYVSPATSPTKRRSDLKSHKTER